MNSKQRSFKSNKIRNMRLTSPADEEDLRTRWQEERLFYCCTSFCDENKEICAIRVVLYITTQASMGWEALPTARF